MNLRLQAKHEKSSKQLSDFFCEGGSIIEQRKTGAIEPDSDKRL